MPDLAIEVKSPDDSNTELREKALFYLKNGTRVVILAFPAQRRLEIYSEAAVETLNINDTFDGSDVLPDFSLAVRDIFAD